MRVSSVYSAAPVTVGGGVGVSKTTLIMQQTCRYHYLKNNTKQQSNKKNTCIHPLHIIMLISTSDPVTTAWIILRLRMEERPPIWRVAVNKLNKQPRTTDEGWSSILGVGRGANNPSP
jgi:hypothetical protein